MNRPPDGIDHVSYSIVVRRHEVGHRDGVKYRKHEDYPADLFGGHPHDTLVQLDSVHGRHELSCALDRAYHQREAT